MPFRLDTWLVQNGFFESREKAQLAVRQGAVLINGLKAQKPAQQVGDDDEVQIQGEVLRYVSRGGLKLEKAIRVFGLGFKGKTVIDLGASTGGFTDCALQQGAARIVAVDVGEGQLHPRLQADPRVLSLENTDLRQLKPEQLGGEKADILVADLSFISLEHVFPYLPPLLKTDAQVVVLIKPQFEMKVRRRFKGGIIRDERLRQKLAAQAIGYAEAAGFRLEGITPTDADGQHKNVEFLALFSIFAKKE
ncbi:MAG: TlyA family RNA methyltransferase [Lewinellaceae bacterium]|nr:TlyA family RNA methyltransferase [Lewinellaceae bacterium]